jgi:hypothetical protein
MNPVSGHAGTWPIILQLEDEVNSVSSTFSVIVTAPANQPPSFASTLTGQTIIAGISSTFTLPGATDPESQSITYTFSLPPYGSYNLGPPVKLTFVAGVSDVGTNPTVTVTLSDGTNTVPNSFVLTVNANSAPYFS